MKIVSIVGARPQLIKAGVLAKKFQEYPWIEEKIVHTGQHYDYNMSQIFLDELEFPPISYNLQVGSSSHAMQTAEMMIGIEKILLNEKPDWVLIYGDTNSTLAGVLSASKLHFPIAHIEAGLRSYNRKMPEEINRLVADQLSDQLFVPTEQALLNLKKEGFSEDRMLWVGDIMLDAALYYGEKAEKNSQILKQLELVPKQYILATIHRAENTNNQLKLLAIFTALEQLCQLFPVIVPIHPRTKLILEKDFPQFLNKSKIQWIAPLGFLDMIQLERNAKLIITDSGGVQKEAFFYKVQCVTLREETEWVELVKLGWNTLIPPNDSQRIYEGVQTALKKQGEMNCSPYGKGQTASLIIQFLGNQRYANMDHQSLCYATQ